MRIHRLVLLPFSALFLYSFVTASAQTVSPENEPVVQVVKKVRPAVVNIYTETVETRIQQDPSDLFFERFFGNSYIQHGQITQVPVRSLGSGVLVSSAGYIVTNEHVAGRASQEKIKVTLADKKTYDAKLIRSDSDLDLALIKIESKDPLPMLDLVKLSPNLLGQTVIAIGNPIGFESSVSQGILSATNRNITVDGVAYDALLQTDAAINPGNSGGPLVDILGQFVGLNTAKVGKGAENIGFAIPAERVAVFVRDSIDIAEGRKKEPPKASLLDLLKTKFGMTVQEMDQPLAESFGYTAGTGLLVSHVEPGSPAEQVGIQKGMLLRGVGPYRVRTEAELPHELQRLKKGESARVTVSFYRQAGNRYVLLTSSVQMQAR
ncbi:MAG: trypsin-like peptidase domain-containing protein [Methylacidiphilales bacterium]|nr:trypsin-like peptidase domain-containing protein [Candidatus Methylacidiphilales bacterium]